MQLGIDHDGVLLDQLAAGLVITLGFDALHLAEHLAEELAQFLEIVDHGIGLAVLADHFNHVVSLAAFVAPLGDQFAVAHVRLLDVLAQLDARQLGHHAVQDVFRIAGLGHVERRHQSQLDQLGVAQVVEAEEVGAGLFERRAVTLQLTAFHTRRQLARAVAQTFVEVGVEIVGQLAVFVHPLAVLGAEHELLVETVAVGGHIIGIGDVVDGDRLRTVLLANPVGIGKVDADGRRGITVAAQHRHGDDLGRNALHDRLAVGFVHGRMVLEPLGVVGNDLRAVAGLLVHEVDVAFPRRLAPQRIAVILDEAVDEVDVRHGVLHPADVVTVELFQIARLIIADERRDVALLRLLGHGLRLLEPIDDLLDGRRIHAAHLPDPLVDAVRLLLLHQLRIESVGDRLGIARIGIGHVGVELLGLGLAHVAVIVARRGPQQVVAGLLVQPRLVHFGIEDRDAYRPDHVVQLTETLHGNRLANVEEILLGEFGHELVVRIVVVDAVGEPHLFQVLLQRLPFGRRAVAGIILIDCFQRAAHGKVDGAVLVEEDVAAALGGLGQVIDELLLLKRQLVEAGDFVTDDLDVVEAVDDPRRLALRRLAARSKRNSGKRHRYDFFHVVRVL